MARPDRGPGLAVDGSARSETSNKVASIAVLPFADMSPARDQDYFCEGMAEEIINALTKIENLRVVARMSAFRFKGRPEDARQIGDALNVKMLLEGSVRTAGNHLRVTAQLINVEDGYHLWSERYDRELEDVFEIQDEITSEIVTALDNALLLARTMDSCSVSSTTTIVERRALPISFPISMPG